MKLAIEKEACFSPLRSNQFENRYKCTKQVCIQKDLGSGGGAVELVVQLYIARLMFSKPWVQPQHHKINK